MTTLGYRSMREIIEQWRPAFNEKWVCWIQEAHARYTSDKADDRICGVKDFATIFGDSGAPEMCILVALYGLRLAKTERDRNSLESHIRIVNCGLGIERPKESVAPGEGIPTVDFAKREKWLIDREAWQQWRDSKLDEFGSDRQVAADCCVRLACIHTSILTGEAELTFESLCDPSLWTLR